MEVQSELKEKSIELQIINGCVCLLLGPSGVLVPRVYDVPR